mmetsp:Transcript_18267/g.23132  ORF Transcript_18267/g.23132 Transcript_18267/m.23132 type:complete len:271 (-) Transcript_18267:53-865(-)|eukprot:CAMPEP_0206194854 /NCGR_PEP_ID=MMETSP0166-20121206/7467_1 /ASSEMBLY_ACC=CAM_ASM_000260 /TAXON_ID=95228 /ORGANISM="Vannella robusta, Strain DIVA3 518/3/11/1/6" /LENGTH=270 /DNA_ID=CAMNT_0053611951 /DNA_START=127 /DNA_END=939 /DNA_ORIENTATION=+
MNSRVKIAAVAIGIGAIVTGANSCLYDVDGGERALLFDKLRGGVQDRVRGEGTHFRIPFLQDPIIFDIRTSPQAISTTTGSKDLQTVKVTLRVLYEPDPANLKPIYRQYGMYYAETVLPNIGNEILKAVVAQYDAGELITQREQVSSDVTRALVKRAGDFHIRLRDVSITHLEFSDDYMKAVEHKQVAQQYAERQKFLVEKATQEKEAEVILAAGETEAAKLINEGMAAGNEFLELRKIEAAKVIAQTMSHSRNVSYLPGGGNVLLNLPQ